MGARPVKRIGAAAVWSGEIDHCRDTLANVLNEEKSPAIARGGGEDKVGFEHGTRGYTRLALP